MRHRLFEKPRDPLPPHSRLPGNTYTRTRTHFLFALVSFFPVTVFVSRLYTPSKYPSRVSPLNPWSRVNHQLPSRRLRGGLLVTRCAFTPPTRGESKLFQSDPTSRLSLERFHSRRDVFLLRARVSRRRLVV